jgi:uncharacterized membrane protein YjdF
MKKERVHIILAYIMQGLILALTIFSFYEKEYLLGINGILCLIVTFLPLILKRRWNITLPWTLNLLIVFSLCMHAAGESAGLYTFFYPIYDKIGHFIGSITIALLGLALLIALENTNLKLEKSYAIFFIIIFTMAIGAIWEIAEFTTDQLLGTRAQPGLTDTMYDLIFDFLGGLFIALLANSKFEKVKCRVAPKICRKK